jgi:hypothetical protein
MHIFSMHKLDKEREGNKMRNYVCILLAMLVTTMVLVFSVSTVYSETAKEGSDTGKNYATGTSKALPMGEERLHVTYEGSGIYVSDIEEGFLNNASMHFLGALHAVNGAFEESGFMVSTVPDGDKVFATWKGSGNLGKDAKGTYTYVGGTGKYTGITGGGEFTRSNLQPPSKGVWAAITLFTGNWKLP